ncbi:MAG: TrkA family potassium uptake protein [Planctomycetota bacterium]
MKARLVTARLIFRTVLLLVVLPVVGTVGFMAIEGWGFLDSLYMAVITLTTVGFQEVHPLSAGGRVFVMLFLVVGVGMFLFGVVQVGETLLRMQLSEVLGTRKRQSVIRALSGHIIVCGCGRMGHALCEQLSRQRTAFVVIDRDRATLERGGAPTDPWPVIVGDATDDRILEEAGIARALGLAAVLSSDADNLYVTISARLLNPTLQILVRATEERNIAKLKRAGANRVISLYEAGAHKIARLLANPNLDDFVEVFGSRNTEVDLAQFTVAESAPYCGKALSEAGFRDAEVLIVGVLKAAGGLLMPPPSATVIAAGDRLFAVGKSAALTRFTSTRI